MLLKDLIIKDESICDIEEFNKWLEDNEQFII